MIYNDYNGYRFTVNPDKDNNTLFVPLNVDSEFFTPPMGSDHYRFNPSCTLTIQIRGLTDNTGKIYSHKTNSNARHDLISTDFACLDYLKDNGFNMTVFKDKNSLLDKHFPKMIFLLYGHFICADFIRLFDGDLQKWIRECVTNPKPYNGIEQIKRLRTYSIFNTKYGQRTLPYLKSPFIVSYQGKYYQLCIQSMDTIGIAGNASYAALGQLTSVELPYKNLLNKEGLSAMDKTYQNRENDFDLYALGDLKCTDMVDGFNALFHKVLKDLKLPVLPASLTIGATVAKLIKSAIVKQLPDKQSFDILTYSANQKYLLENTLNTTTMLSKVDGGRCFNNRPTDIYKQKTLNNIMDLLIHKSAIVDIDIDGAYSNSLINQIYPLGIAKTFSYPIGNNNKYLTLREFFKKYGKELKPRLWTMRVSSKQPLKYSQDFIASWIVPPNKIKSYLTQDDTIGVRDGYVKIFENEITLGTITSDILELIDNICSEKQRKELYDNLLVIDAMWYDATQEVNTVGEVLKSIELKPESNTSDYKDDTRTNTETCSHKWYGISLGDLIFKELIKKRKEYPKGTPENTFYKLLINTGYGTIASRFFDIGNLVVGNNITAKCRCMAWYLEKGLNAFQTITDGCTFELDNVNYPVETRRLQASNLVRTYDRPIRETRIKQQPLNIEIYTKLKDGTRTNTTNLITNNVMPQIDSYLLENNTTSHPLIIETTEGTAISTNLIAKMLEIPIQTLTDPAMTLKKELDIGADVMNHLRNIFPNVSILHEQILDINNNPQIGHYKLDVKCISKEIILHGNADYALLENYQLDGLQLKPIDDIYKMRGYKDDQLILHTITDDNETPIETIEISPLETEYNGIIDTEHTNIPKEFLTRLKSNPSSVERIDIFIQNKILKANDYRQGYRETYQHTNHDLGGTYPMPRLLTEITLGQFLFKTSAQYDSWQNRHYKNKQEQGQGIETNYQNTDGTLNYQKAIKEIPQIINKEQIIRYQKKTHPYFGKYLTQKSQIKKMSEKKS